MGSYVLGESWQNDGSRFMDSFFNVVIFGSMYPPADVLSQQVRMHDNGGKLPSMASTQMVIICVINSRTLLVRLERSDCGIQKRHPLHFAV